MNGSITYHAALGFLFTGVELVGDSRNPLWCSPSDFLAGGSQGNIEDCSALL